MANILYTAYLLEDRAKEVLSEILSNPIHPNVYGHHSTIAFGKNAVELPEKLTTIKVIGRLTTDIADCLVVDSTDNLSINQVPHITLSIANGSKPVDSNMELFMHPDQIVYFDAPVDLPVRIVTFFRV